MNAAGTDYELDDNDHKIVMTGDSSNPAYCGQSMTDEYGNTYNNALCTAKAGKASDSICPKGWKAAEYSGSGSYLDLFGVYNFVNNDNGFNFTPLSLVRAGAYSYGNGSLYYRGQYGLYWESMVNSSTSAYLLYFDSTNLYPQNSNNKGNGFSLRCVIR